MTETYDVDGPFQSYVPGDGCGSLPYAVATKVFVFLATVCEAALLEPTTFIPGSHTSNSHTDLKNAPMC